MYYVDYCGISELGRHLQMVSRMGHKLSNITQYYRKGQITFVLVITDQPDKE